MTDTEFRATLTEAFNTHMFMNKRDKHTINELMYVLKHHAEFGGADFNVSISKNNGEWWCIPSLDAFVSIPALSVWFDDDRVEFEVEECGEEKFNCITVYEREEE